MHWQHSMSGKPCKGLCDAVNSIRVPSITPEGGGTPENAHNRGGKQTPEGEAEREGTPP